MPETEEQCQRVRATTVESTRVVLRSRQSMLAILARACMMQRCVKWGATTGSGHTAQICLPDVARRWLQVRRRCVSAKHVPDPGGVRLRVRRSSSRALGTQRTDSRVARTKDRYVLCSGEGEFFFLRSSARRLAVADERSADRLTFCVSAFLRFWTAIGRRASTRSQDGA